MGPLANIAALIGALAGISATAAWAWVQDERRLEPGATLTRQLAPGQAHHYRTATPEAGSWRVGVAQAGVDVVVTLKSGAGATLVRVDSPLDQRGDEWLTAALDAGDYFVEVAAHDVRGPPARYEIRFERLPVASPQARLRLDAELAATSAAAGYAQGSPDAWRKAAADYETAADLWGRLGEPRREARAAYCAGALHRLLGQGEPAMAWATRALPLWRAVGDRFREAATLTEIGLLRQIAGALPEARAAFEDARAIQEEIGDEAGAAISANNLCLVMMHQGRFKDSIPCWRRVIALTARETVLFGPEFPLASLGAAYDMLGESADALDAFERAMTAFRENGDRLYQARTANNLGVHYQNQGRLQEALDLFGEALQTFRDLAQPLWEANALNNLGHTHNLLGQPQRALFFLERSLALRRQVGNRPGEVIALNNLGQVHQRTGELERALARHQAALELALELANPSAEALSRYELGRVRQAMGSRTAALEEFNRARRLFAQIANRPKQADALRRAGAVQRLLGRPRASRDALEQALAMYREMALDVGQIGARYELALTARDLGRDDEAARHAQAAVRLIETVRRSVIDPDLRDTFFAVRRDAYELGVDLLMSRHEREPEGGHAARALTLSERARARGLLERLADGVAPIDRDLAPAQAERLARARGRVNGKARRRQQILERAHTAAEAAAALAEVEAALQELAEAETEVRRNHPRFDLLANPRPIDAAAMQTLADRDTRLLVYSLGESHSYGWLVGPTRVTPFSLPGRTALETLTRQAHQQLSVLEPGPADAQRQTLARLSDLLFGPVAGQLAVKRLAVVADGVLHYLPFGALPLPGAEPAAGGPLAQSFEITHAPSASFLALMRRSSASSAAEKPVSIAVFADPVFVRDDPRIEAVNAAPASTAGAAPTADLGFSRLPETRREAEAILALAPPDAALRALDFQASRATLFGQDLSRYRFLHFATHGELDARRPRLSGLALSHVDRTGAPGDGFVRMHELYGLRLDADLVALSGCETALGKDIRGEGLVGLTRAFMYAGARGVLASLWRVPDRATAELMARFYQAMLRDGLSPAAALRAAQGWVRAQRRWRDPFYWAGFVLQGDF